MDSWYCSFFGLKPLSLPLWFLLKNARSAAEQTETVTRMAPTITHIPSNSYFRVSIISQTTFNIKGIALASQTQNCLPHWWVWVSRLQWHINTLYQWLLWIHSVELFKVVSFSAFYLLKWSLGTCNRYFSWLLGINVASRILCGIHQMVVVLLCSV